MKIFHIRVDASYQMFVIPADISVIRYPVFTAFQLALPTYKIDMTASNAVSGGERSEMLKTWTELYQLMGNEKYMRFVKRYWDNGRVSSFIAIKALFQTIM